MQRKREHVWISLLLAAAGLAWFGLLLARGEGDAATRVALERDAVTRLEEVLRAQGAHHARHGRYAWAAELVSAGLIDGLAEEGWVTAPRYRLDVLLPAALRPGGLVQLASERSGRSSERLRQRHFAVVARPWGDAPSGRRTFYADETGDVWFHEGVVVVGVESVPLPTFLLTQGRPSDLSTHRWIKLADVQENEPDEDED